MNNEKCEFAERPFSRLDPGLCGAPATHTIIGATDPKPFHCCEKHFHLMLNDSQKLTPAKAAEIMSEAIVEANPGRAAKAGDMVDLSPTKVAKALKIIDDGLCEVEQDTTLTEESRTKQVAGLREMRETLLKLSNPPGRKEEQ